MLENGICSLRCFFIFASGIFTLINGPLWVSERVKVFAVGPQVPVWLHRWLSWASRLAGMAILVVWAWDATGAWMPTLFMVYVLASGIFCLFSGPAWLVTRVGVFNRGRYAPAWLEKAGMLYIRMVGYLILLGGMATGITLATS